jgi:hypothetical protein
MHDEGEAHQAMLERMLMLEDALDRAEAGVASKDDWDMIRFECGMPRRQPETTQSNRSE